ncbi:hypothetical protein ALQ04_03739 [Pseudomonas cichorii]|uniref:DUF2878 domain-containing protein n=1 Tax=Pseudomonas cichorii TaxID=36746 RepID=A0A3M4LVP4_PSECI|nr:DUF2878 domain-containing protein [Pseudomonas cichorii]RMQ45487.1 hypothetical protein ALQ04_03739 [Pseudomonas cichorii]
MLKTLANALLFQIGWFACVLGGNSAWLLIAVAVVAIHVLWRNEVRLLLAVTVTGTLLDSILMNIGVFDFGTDGPLIPLWLVILWAVLATTLRHCLAWTACPWWRASLLGAIGGPMSYYAGSQLANVQLPMGLWPSLVLLGLVWAVVFPLLQRLASHPLINTRTGASH